jgi:steroid delta-isomerase-like uncharacterized protein
VPNINQVVDVPSADPPHDRDRTLSPAKEDAMGMTSNAAIVCSLLDAVWNRGDFSAIETCVAADHVDHGSDGIDVGRAHMIPEANEYRTAFPDLQMTFEDQISESDRVVTRWTATGTNLGPFQGMPATGRPARVSGIFINRVVDGQITETWSSYDRLGLMHQLGFVKSVA